MVKKTRKEKCFEYFKDECNPTKNYTSIILALIIWILLPLLYYGVLFSLTSLATDGFPNVEPFDSPSTIFSEERVRRQITEIVSIGTKPVFSKGNLLMLEYLKIELSKFLNFSSNPIQTFHIEIDYQPFHLMKSKTQTVPLYNVLLLIRSDKNINNHTLMLNSHYDTAFPSPGASDDGHAVCMFFELIQNILYSKKPLLHPILFMFNNAEESMYKGSEAFGNHKWNSMVKRFLNFESGGGPGKAGVIKSAPGYIIEEVSKCSLIKGNSLFIDVDKLIPQGTDFQNYHDEQKIPGIDFAFFEWAFLYHSVGDTLDKIDIGAIQLLGETAHQILDVYVYSPDSVLLDPEAAVNGKSYVYSDFLSLNFFVVSNVFFKISGMFLFFVSFLVIIIAVIVEYYKEKKELSELKKPKELVIKKFLLYKLGTILLYYLSYIVSMIFGIIFDIISALISALINRMSYYGNFYMSVIAYGIVCILGMIFGQFIFFKIFQRTSRDKVYKYTQEKWLSLYFFIVSAYFVISVILGLHILIVMWISYLSTFFIIMFLLFQNICYFTFRKKFELNDHEDVDVRKSIKLEFKDENDDENEWKEDEITHEGFFQPRLSAEEIFLPPSEILIPGEVDHLVYQQPIDPPKEDNKDIEMKTAKKVEKEEEEKVNDIEKKKEEDVKTKIEIEVENLRKGNKIQIWWKERSLEKDLGWIFKNIIKYRLVFMLFPVYLGICVMLLVHQTWMVLKGTWPILEKFNTIALPTVVQSIFVGLCFVFLYICFLPCLHRAANFLKLLLFTGFFSLLFSFILMFLSPYNENQPKWVNVENFLYGNQSVDISSLPLNNPTTIHLDFGNLYSYYYASDASVMRKKSKVFDEFLGKIKDGPICPIPTPCPDNRDWCLEPYCLLELHEDSRISRVRDIEIVKYSDNKIGIQVNYNLSTDCYVVVKGENYTVEWEEDYYSKNFTETVTYYQTNMFSEYFKGNFTIYEPVSLRFMLVYRDLDAVPLIKDVFEKQKWMVLVGYDITNYETFDYHTIKQYIHLNP